MNPATTTLDFTALARQLDQKTIQPCYFFYGPEGILIESALKKLKGVALEPGTDDFNWTIFRADGDDMNWSAFSDALNSLPLIPSRRVVILKRAGKALQMKGVAGIIERAIQHPAADLTLVLIDEEADPKKAHFKRLQEACTCVYFPHPKPIELQRYMKEFITEFDKEISDEALSRILTDSEPGLRDLFSKLEVLVFYIGDKKVIETEDVESCTAFTRELEVFNLLRALGMRDGDSARGILQHLLRRRGETGALIHLLYRQFWALYRMKYLQEQKVPASQWQGQLNLKPPFLEKIYRTYLPKFSRRELGKSLEALATADRIRKTSAIEDEFLLWELVETLLEPVPGNKLSMT